MTTQAISNQNITPDLATIAQQQPIEPAQNTAPSEGNKAAEDFISQLKAGIRGSTSPNTRDLDNMPRDTALWGHSNMVEAQLQKLSPADQRDFIETLVNQHGSGELNEAIRPSTFDLGRTLGAVQLQEPQLGEAVAGHLKDLYESGRINDNDVKTLFDGNNLAKGTQFLRDTSAAEGLSQIAKNVGNEQFSETAVGSMLAGKPEGPVASGIYEGALDVAQDALNRGEPQAAFALLDKMFNDSEMRDDMIKKLGGEGSDATDGRSGLLSMVNDLDKQNKATGNMNEHFGGTKTAADRLENVWQANHEHIGGDTNAVRESNEYFTNNVERLNWESRHPGGEKNEDDDGKLISDYVQNVLLDETVEAGDVNRAEAVNAVTGYKDRLMDKVQNGASPGERLEAAGDLGNLAGSVGAGIDNKFKSEVEDADSAAEMAALVGGAIIDSIPVVGDIAESFAGEALTTAAKEYIKGELEDKLKDGMKPKDRELFDGLVDGLRADLPQASDRITPEDRANMTPEQITAKEAQNRANAELHTEFNGAANEHALRLLQDADD